MSDVGWYEYGARLYDPTIGRFTTVDRFSEKYSFQSVYLYAGNNPIGFVDVNGDSTGSPRQNEQEFFVVGQFSMNFGLNRGNDLFSGVVLNLGSMTLKEDKSEITWSSNGVVEKSNEHTDFSKDATIKTTHGLKYESPFAGGKVELKTKRDRETFELFDIERETTVEFASILFGRDTKNLKTGYHTQEIGLGEDFSASAFGLSFKGKLEVGVRVINPSPRNYSVRKRVRNRELERLNN